MGRTYRKPVSAWIGSAAFLMVVSLAPSHALDNENYGYVRSIEGYSDLIQNASNEVVKLTANYPIIVGDKIRVSERARLETVLPDGSYLRLGNNTEIEFQQLARSADTHGTSTQLLLHQGEAQLVTHTDSASLESFRIDTSNATIYPREPGRYRVLSDGSSWTEVSVRQGYAEVVTESGSAIVQSGESLIIEGARDPLLSLGAATQLSALELWGDELTQTASRYATDYVDSSLAYASTPLSRHGSWMQTESSYFWRPHVSTGWRPYHSGWWASTPSGLTWVSTEPWGWLTYHYGVWDYGPSYGWVWYPGRHYTPAAVYWYWGPTHVGWIPAGYYTRYYGHRYPRYVDPYAYRNYDRGGISYYGSGIGFQIGVHGTAGGRGSYWNDWTFARHHRLGHRGGHAYLRTGAQLSNQGTFQKAVPVGIIATDTRSLTPDLWQQPTRAMESLRNARQRSPSVQTGIVAARQDLPDLSPWIARRRELPEPVARTMMPRTMVSSVSGSTGNRPRSQKVLVAPQAPDRRSIASDRTSMTETWRLGTVQEAPSRHWGSDLRQRRQARQPVTLPLWNDIQNNRQKSRSLSSSGQTSLNRSHLRSPSGSTLNRSTLDRSTLGRSTLGRSTLGRSSSDRSSIGSRSSRTSTRSVGRSSARPSRSSATTRGASSSRSSLGSSSRAGGRSSASGGMGSSRSSGSRSRSGGMSRGGGQPPSR